jgi:hypothetical protein
MFSGTKISLPLLVWVFLVIFISFRVEVSAQKPR